jgi:hypothetical protein
MTNFSLKNALKLVISFILAIKQDDRSFFIQQLYLNRFCLSQNVAVCSELSGL